jgi:hypothetical protein
MGLLNRKVMIGLAIPLLAALGIVAVMNIPTASNQGYAPEQPIPFSHKLHAGTNKIACTYCHSSVEKSAHASVPAVNVCMNCHSIVKTDSPWIKKVWSHFKEGRPIEWVRVHELPDHAYFNHKRHVSKGVSCQTCHGDVANMEKVYQKSPLTMGWCIDCHRGNTTPKEVLARVYPDQKNPHGPVASQDCYTCHK